jgi:hypothetical protein
MQITMIRNMRRKMARILPMDTMLVSFLDVANVPLVAELAAVGVELLGAYAVVCEDGVLRVGLGGECLLAQASPLLEEVIIGHGSPHVIEPLRVYTCMDVDAAEVLVDHGQVIVDSLLA